MPKHVFLIGYYGFGNVGDELLVSKTISLYKELYPQTQLSVLYTHTFQKEGVRYLSRRCWGGIVRTFFSVDEICFSGGSLFQDKSSVWSFRYYALFLWLGLIMKKTVRLLANGFGPVDNVFNQQLCQRLFPKLSASSFRDEETESLFLSYLPRDKVFLSSDLAFYHSLFTQSHFDLSAPIALSLRHCNEDTSILPELLKDREWIGIGTDETEDLPSYSDLKMRVSWFLEPDEGPSVSVIISMRYHSCVWAILRGIPFIAIGSDPKLRSIARLFQQESFSSFFELKRNGEMIFSQLASYQKAILSNRTHLMTRTKEFSACLR